jgi:hypothetical protein
MDNITCFEAQKMLKDWRQIHIDIFQNLCGYDFVDNIIRFHKPENCFLIVQKLICIDTMFIKSFKIYKDKYVKNSLYFKVVLKDIISHYQYKNKKIGISFLEICPFYDKIASINNSHFFNIPIQYYIFF